MLLFHKKVIITIKRRKKEQQIIIKLKEDKKLSLRQWELHKRQWLKGFSGRSDQLGVTGASRIFS